MCRELERRRCGGGCQKGNKQMSQAQELFCNLFTALHSTSPQPFDTLPVEVPLKADSHILLCILIFPFVLTAIACLLPLVHLNCLSFYYSTAALQSFSFAARCSPFIFIISVSPHYHFLAYLTTIYDSSFAITCP